MANGIKIGNLDISSFKVGSGDCTIYLGDTLLYQPIPPEIKWTAIYVGGTTSSAECDSSSTIVEREITTSNLASVEIGSCVTSIGESAFLNCGSLTSITIPDSVTTIGDTAFLNDSSLTSINIPSGVTSIGMGAFLNCGGLTGITVNATTPPTLSTNVFANTNNCPIYVPEESVATYKSSWSQYASRIQAILSLQWVTFNDNDTIPQGNVYGIRINSQYAGHSQYNPLEIGSDSDNCAWFGGGTPTRAPQFTAYFYTISNGVSTLEDSWDDGLKEFIFSNYGGESYYYEDGTKTTPYGIQLYIYA
ncbi:MAG: leucine-rich repeat domain-containing protein [Methanobrevibacter sp.]|nr:leucine-rich repeat domain-containing protein [Methanobrevibacter sp.]